MWLCDYVLLGYWICVVLEIFICNYLQVAAMRRATTRQSIHVTTICDVHNDRNHLAVVCVKMCDISPPL